VTPVIGLPEDFPSDAGFIGRLVDLVEVDPRRGRAMGPALARALVAADLESAQRLRRHAPFFDFITLDGDILHTSGLIEGGARRPEGAGLLTRRRLKADLVLAIETGRAHIEGLDLLIAGLDGDRAAAATGTQLLAARLGEAEKGLVALEHRVQAALDEESRTRMKLETVAREKSMAREEDEALGLELQRLSVTMADLERARNSRESEISTAQDEIGRMRIAATEAGEAISAVRSSLSAATQRLEALDMDLARMLESDQELRDRIERETTRQGELALRAEDASRREATAADALHELAGRRVGLEAGVRDGEVALAERREEIERQALEVRSARELLEEARAVRERVSLEKERASADLRHLVDGALTGAARPDATLDDLFGVLTDDEKALDLDTVRATVADLRDRRDKMGPVNMLALDEFRELEERYTFLTAQRKDLTEAIASLKETIARINRTSRERFLDAFEKIRLGFAETFKVLFGGGRADLRLMTGDGEEDVLECGLEIIAQPPGKRLQSVTLMSGGEKALTAIALLFAIFKFRPSPFCLLDEVDAPLDEANVIRFNDLLKTMHGETQFVMITHNRRSMEAADVLYGITMEEPGVSRTMSVVLGGRADRAEAVRSLPAILTAKHRGAGRGGRAGGPLLSGGNGGNGVATEPSTGKTIEPAPGTLPA
jgi:chromosome segregation protein